MPKYIYYLLFIFIIYLLFIYIYYYIHIDYYVEKLHNARHRVDERNQLPIC